MCSYLIDYVSVFIEGLLGGCLLLGAYKAVDEEKLFESKLVTLEPRVEKCLFGRGSLLGFLCYHFEEKVLP